MALLVPGSEIGSKNKETKKLHIYTVKFLSFHIWKKPKNKLYLGIESDEGLIGGRFDKECEEEVEPKEDEVSKTIDSCSLLISPPNPTLALLKASTNQLSLFG